MKPVFADTFYFLALLSEDDGAHLKALEISRLNLPIITTSWVLTELADAFSAPLLRPYVINLFDALQTSRDCEIIRASPESFESGFDLFRRRADKGWSLTDCISFVTMSQRAITDALTGDHHFEQAGFRALLK